MNHRTLNRAIPKFLPEQIVKFLGGIGKIKSYQPDAETWTYAIEMEMGPEPTMGRIGYETTIVLHEADIQGCLS